MQADQKPVIWTVVIATIFMLVVVGFGISSFNSNVGYKLDVMNTKLEGLDIDEQAIANAIVAGIVMPEVPEWTAPEMPDTAKLNELWEAEYSDEVDALKGNASEEAILEFLDDNDEFDDNGTYFFEHDDIYDLVTEGVDCDGDCVVEYVKEYDDREVEVINLGLDDEDDREVSLSTRIRVKVFTDEDDLDEYFFERVDINSVVTSDDGDLEAEVTYSL